MRKKENNVNLYYWKNGQAKRDIYEDKTKRNKEREKRIKENKNKREEMNSFDLDTETVIQMTNRNKIKKEELKRRRMTREEQRRKRRNKKIKFILKLIFFIGLITGAIVFAMTSPIFNIKNIEVIGNEIVSADTIISLSELKTEQNIFSFTSFNTIKNIKSNAYIEDVKIHRSLPNTIKIDVSERTPKYSVDFMGKYAYINTQGYILEISEDSKNMLIIHGISSKEDEVVPGNRLNEEDLGKLEDVIKIMSSAKENDLETLITSIDITNKNEYSINLENEKKKIHLGDSSNLSNKMLYAVAIIQEEKDKEGDIYVNGDINNKFKPYFREKVEI